jgi:hypothetical protein
MAVSPATASGSPFGLTIGGSFEVTRGTKIVWRSLDVNGAFLQLLAPWIVRVKCGPLGKPLPVLPAIADGVAHRAATALSIASLPSLFMEASPPIDLHLGHR